MGCVGGAGGGRGRGGGDRAVGAGEGLWERLVHGTVTGILVTGPADNSFNVAILM